jgi:hypothetical protein
MRRPPVTVALVLTALLPSACGGAAAGSSQPASTRNAPITADAASLVLQLADLESGYVPVAKETRIVPLSEELKGDSPSTRPVDRAGFRGGYEALYAGAMNSGVLSEVLTYKTESSATTVYADTTGLHKLIAQLHGRRDHTPSGAPGTDPIMITGSIPVQGSSEPAYLLAWRHSTVLEIVLQWGPDASAAHLVSLANRQDNHIATAT